MNSLIIEPMLDNSFYSRYPEKELALSMLDGKLKITLLCHLGLIGTKRFGELKQLISNVAQQTLATGLRELQAQGLVNRQVYREVPPRVEYSLTELGKSLLPLLDMLYDWGLKNLSLRPSSLGDVYTEKRLTLSVIEGKWKIIILCHLGLGGTKRFGELQKLIPGITKKMLTQRLRELEDDHLVQRRVYAEIPPKVEYSLTGQGASLFPILKALETWGEDYLKTFCSVN